MDQTERIEKVTFELNEKMNYLCQEYDVPLATMVGILTCMIYELNDSREEEQG